MNHKLLQRVEDALQNQENRISLRGYKGVSRADLEVVLMAVGVQRPPNYVDPVVSKLYADITGN